MIAGESVSPLVAHAIARSEDEEAALLNRIAPSHALPEACPEGAKAFQNRARMEIFRRMTGAGIVAACAGILLTLATCAREEATGTPEEALPVPPTGNDMVGAWKP